HDAESQRTRGPRTTDDPCRQIDQYGDENDAEESGRVDPGRRPPVMCRMPGAEGFHTMQKKPMQPVLDEGPASEPEPRAGSALDQPCARPHEDQERSEAHRGATE